MRFILLYSFISFSLNAFAGDIKYGVIGRVEMNRSMVFDPFKNAQIKSSPNPSFAIGPYMSFGLGKSFFIDCNVSFVTNIYQVNFQKEDAVFNSAKIRFAEMDVRLNQFIFQNKNHSGLYVSAGIQNLYRRWGEENYINDIVPNTYWPNNRLVYSLGLGYNSNFKKNSFRLLVGSNYNPSIDTVYDVKWYQHHFSIILTINKPIKGKSKMQSSCPNQF